MSPEKEEGVDEEGGRWLRGEGSWGPGCDEALYVS